MVAGIVVLLAPLALAMSTAVAITGTIVGALCIALALAGTEHGGRGTIPVAAQAVYDRGLGVGLILAGLVFGAAGEPAALVLFAAIGAAVLLVTSVTKYSASPA